MPKGQIASISRAPRPKKSSFSRSLYDALDALRGPAPIEQIAECLPATDDASKWTQFKDYKKISQRLKTAMYNGYVCQQPDGSWTIAPKQFYENAQEHMREQRERDALPPEQRLPLPQQHMLKSVQSYTSNQMLLAFFGGMAALFLLELAIVGVFTLLGNAA